LPVTWLSRAELQRREPFLNARVTHALFSAQDHQVDNRALVTALHAASVKAGVVIHDDTSVDEIIIDGHRVTGLKIKNETMPAHHVVLCAGAWSGSIKGLPRTLAPPVFPMKGQLTALQMDVRNPLLRHVLWTPAVYLVPRGDGRLIIGATMEDKGFDETLTAGGLLHLLRETWEVLPGIEELPLLESWVGFRPTSRDDAPILGASGVEGLTYATGQHRHGILMTPLLSAVISTYIQSGTLPPVAAPFTMQRFS
jgi:glycine oxidase